MKYTHKQKTELLKHINNCTAIFPQKNAIYLESKLLSHTCIAQ